MQVKLVGNDVISDCFWGLQEPEIFELDKLEFRTLAQYEYLKPGSMKYIYFYNHVW